MTLVYTTPGYRDSDKPGTHVLLIGVGTYPHLPGGHGRQSLVMRDRGQLRAPMLGAKELATWFSGKSDKGGFSHPETPLATIAILGSDGESTPDSLRSDELDAPSRNAISSAFQEWVVRLKSNRENVGVFYFCGHGVENDGTDFILPSDFANNDENLADNAIDLSRTIRSLRRDVPGPLYFFLDICRTPLDFHGQPRSLSNVRAGNAIHDAHLLVLHGTSPGTNAFADSEGLSYFTDALLRSLSGAALTNSPDGRQVITSESLCAAVEREMAVYSAMRDGVTQNPSISREGTDREFCVQAASKLDADAVEQAAAERAEVVLQAQKTSRSTFQIGGNQNFSRAATEQETCLQADDYADVLASLLFSTTDEICFAIFGAWGRGKTFLSERVGAALKSKGRRQEVIRFSAWKYPTTPEVWVHLYETFADAAFNKPLLTRVPNIARAAIDKRGYGSLLGVYAAIALGAIPIFSLLDAAGRIFEFLYLLLGIYGLIFVWTLVSGVRKTKTRLMQEYLTPSRHAEKLGLQATIGLDLRALLKGWIPAPFDSSFLLGYWAITACLAIAAGLRLGPEANLRWLEETLSMKLVAGTGALPALIATFLILASAAGVMRWLRFGGAYPERVLLVVDDLDRCKPEHLLSVVESIKLLLEDPDINSKVQVMMLVEEEILGHAIVHKYGHLVTPFGVSTTLVGSFDFDRLVRENLEKLFTAHLRLPELSKNEVRELVEAFSGRRLAMREEAERQSRAKQAALEKLQAERQQIVEQIRLSEVVSNRVLVKPATPPRKVMSAPAAFRLDKSMYEGGEDAVYWGATPEELANQREANRKQKMEADARLGAIDAQLIELAGPETEPDHPLERLKAEDDKVLSEHEVEAILAEMIRDDSELRSHLGPRTVRAFLSRYQLARLLLGKLNVDWTPPALARELARRFVFTSAKHAPRQSIDAKDADSVNLVRVVDQVS